MTIPPGRLVSQATTPRILVDGRPEERIAALDRGFALGDGLFETIAVRAGIPRFWSAHIERLREGCRRLLLPEPPTAALAEDAASLCAGGDNGTLRITWTRGIGARGYAPPADPVPTRVLAFHPGAAPAARALTLRWCDTRLALQPALAGIKHLNRLEQVLARAEWSDPTVDEGIMLASDGRVVECVAANLFLVHGGTLITPDVADCGVAGTTRRRVLAAAETLGLKAAVRRVEVEEVESADEAFVTNAVLGVAPVAAIAERRLAAPGPFTRRLAAAIARLEQAYEAWS